MGNPNKYVVLVPFISNGRKFVPGDVIELSQLRPLDQVIYRNRICVATISDADLIAPKITPNIAPKITPNVAPNVTPKVKATSSAPAQSGQIVKNVNQTKPTGRIVNNKNVIK